MILVMLSVNRIQHIIMNQMILNLWNGKRLIITNSIKRKTLEQLRECPSNWKVAKRHKSNNIKYQRGGLIVKINYHDR